MYVNMSSFWNFAFAALLVIIWIVSGGFVSQASVHLHSSRNIDSHLNKAYWYTFWASFVTWFLVALFILLIILSAIGFIALFGSGVGEEAVVAEGVVAEEESLTASKAAKELAKKKFQEKRKGRKKDEGISWITIIFLGFALILVIITGVLAALAAGEMSKSPNFDRSNSRLRSAYINCIIAASLCLGASGLLIIGIIVYLVIGERRKKQVEGEKAALLTVTETPPSALAPTPTPAPALTPTPTPAAAPQTLLQTGSAAYKQFASEQALKVWQAHQEFLNGKVYEYVTKSPAQPSGK